MNATQKNLSGFDDMESDDLGGDFGPAPAAPEAGGEWPVFAEGRTAGAELPGVIENCPKCGGSGRYYRISRLGAACLKCNGTGKLAFKNPANVRATNREKAADRKARTQATNLEAYEAEHPAIAAWWTGSDFEFAVSLRDAVIKYGHLTERQQAAADRCVEKFNAAKAERAAREAAPKPAVDTAEIERRFQIARDSGVKSPMLRLGDWKFKLAANGSGAIYVTALNDDGRYLGKCLGGKFMKVRETSDAEAEAVIAVAANPAEAAKAYGQKTGMCCVCGRTLTNEESISAMIGPICAGRYGF